MKSSKIEELKRKRQMQIQPKKSQLPYFVIITLVASAFCCYIFNINKIYTTIWVIGILIGITMQRCRFCFVASFRDPLITGSTSLFRAVIIGLIICTVGFSIFQYITVSNIQNYSIEDIPGQISPVGFHTIIGSILFGIGMIIAGACTSGVLVRIGEGHVMQLIVLVGFVIGTILGVSHFKFWDELFISASKAIYIPQYIGFLPTVVIQLIVLGILYLLAYLYDKRNNIMNF